jgi:hypothetical protein
VAQTLLALTLGNGVAHDQEKTPPLPSQSIRCYRRNRRTQGQESPRKENYQKGYKISPINDTNLARKSKVSSFLSDMFRDRAFGLNNHFV